MGRKHYKSKQSSLSAKEQSVYGSLINSIILSRADRILSARQSSLLISLMTLLLLAAGLVFIISIFGFLPIQSGSLSDEDFRYLFRSSRLNLLFIGLGLFILACILLLRASWRLKNRSALDLNTIDHLKRGLDLAVIMSLTDRTGVITYVNDEFCRITQFQAEEIVGSNHSVLRPRFQDQKILQEIEKTVSQGKVWRGTLCNVAKDRSLFWSQTTVIPFQDGNIDPSQFLCISHDISQRVRQELILASIHDLHKVYITSPDKQDLILKVAASKLIDLTGSRCVVFGKLVVLSDNQAKLLVRRFVCSENESNAVNDLCQSLYVERNSSETSEIFGWLNQDLDYPIGLVEFPHEFSSRVAWQLGPTDDITGFWGYIRRDESELLSPTELQPLVEAFSHVLVSIRAKDKELEAIHHLSNLVASIDDIAFEIDEALVVRQLWRSNEQMPSSFQSDMVGRSIIELFAGPSAPALIAAVDKAYALKQCINIEVSWDDERWFAVKINPICFEPSTYVRALILMRDISERKKAENLLEAERIRSLTASKMASLGEMAGGIAHEINNPLAIIQASIRKAKRLSDAKSSCQEELSHEFEVLEKTTGRMAAIVRGLRFFARDDSHDSMRISKVSEIIHDTLSFSAARLSKHGIELEICQSDPDLCIECRPVQISQVILNLLHNSIDAMDGMEKQWIQLEVSDKEGTVQISVTDAGPGIELSIARQMMQPFFTSKVAGKGTGLGLSISSEIVQSHQGLFFYDENSRHTRFVVELPKKQLSRPVALQAS